MATIHIDKVRAALRRHASYLQGSVHDDIARGFLKDGLAHENDSDSGEVVPNVNASVATSRLDRLAAAMADPGRSVPARFAVNMLKRAGVDLNHVGDATQLSIAMRERGLDTDDRMAIKGALRRAGVLA